MAGQHLRDQKKFRIEELLEKEKSERADRIADGDLYSPIFKNEVFHPEGEPILKELNDDLIDILNDLNIIDTEFFLLALEYEDLLTSSLKRIEASGREVIAAREKIMDLNMLCAEGSEFFQVTQITNDLFEDEATINDDGIMTARVTGSRNIRCGVEDVIGNGMEGNEYIYANNKFLFEDSFTGARDYLTDGNIATIYEYQKLNADKSEPYVFADLSTDSTEVFCTITLVAADNMSAIKLMCPDDNVVLQEVHVSADGEEYTSVLKEDIKINKRDMIYQNPDYIYGSGVIAFPLSKYVKITLASDGHTAEKIAFVHEYLE